MKRWILFIGAAACLQANPKGCTVVEGEARLSENGANLEIGVSDRAVLKWESFSIANGETARFVQPSVSSAVLNRVTGSEMSELMGLLKANGQVYLVNPNGVVVGAEGRIDTAAFIASAMELKNEEFMKGGPLAFGEGDGAIINLGSIATAAGSVVLVGKRVENNGEISAFGGNVHLGAGNGFLFDPTGDSLLYIQSDQLNVTPDVSLAVGGSIESVKIVNDGGNIFIRASEGSIDIAESGLFHAADEGKIFIEAGQGVLETRGSMSSASGEVRLLGEKVHLLNPARIDVSGETKGGTVLVGGDYQGKNPEIQNAEHVFVGDGVFINTDAVDSGDGGRAILWGNRSNSFYGYISAQGGGKQGDGGFVEISSPGFLIPRGVVNTLAPMGKSGMLLLDPTDVTIITGPEPCIMSMAPPAIPTYTYMAAVCPVTIDPSGIQTFLMMGNVSIITSSPVDQGASGIITVSDPISWSANDLFLHAANYIQIDAALTVSGTASLSLTGINDIIINAPINWSSTADFGPISNDEFHLNSAIAFTSNANLFLNVADDIFLFPGSSITTTGTGMFSLNPTATGQLHLFNTTISLNQDLTLMPPDILFMNGTVNITAPNIFCYGTPNVQPRTLDTTVTVASDLLVFLNGIDSTFFEFTVNNTTGNTSFLSASTAQKFEANNQGNINVYGSITTVGASPNGSILLNAVGDIYLQDNSVLQTTMASNSITVQSPTNNIGLDNNVTVQGTGAVLFIAGGEILQFPGATAGTIRTSSATDDLTFVVDNLNATPPAYGNGKLTLTSDYILCTDNCGGGGGKVLLFLSQPSLNTLPSMLNNTPYTPGTTSGGVYTLGTNEFAPYWYNYPYPDPPLFEVFFKFVGATAVPVNPATVQQTQVALIEPVANPPQITGVLEGTTQTSSTPDPSAPCRTPPVAVQAF